MIRACAKVNLGLNVVGLRSDGYHNIETVFLPIPLFDKLSIEEQTDEYPSPCQLIVSGNKIECDDQKNLVVKAYNLLANDFSLPPIKILLDKRIPSQSGLGGGSSDAANTVKLLNEKFSLELSVLQMERYAAMLGADCAVFIFSRPAYAEGVGDKLYPIPGIKNQLYGMKLAIVKPEINVSTHEAYAHVSPHYPKMNCLEVVMQPIETWRETLINDFEEYVFSIHLELQEIKTTLYRLGAVYASMSGSGSAIYAFFQKDITLTKLQLHRIFPECYTTLVSIKENLAV